MKAEPYPNRGRRANPQIRGSYCPDTGYQYREEDIEAMRRKDINNEWRRKDERFTK